MRAQPTLVDVGLRILDIPLMDERQQIYKIVGVLELRWHDPALAAADGRTARTLVESQAVTQLKKIWHPDVELDNESDPRKTENQVLIIGGDGHVEYQERFDAMLSSRLDLRRLPFDRQELRVVVQSFGLGEDQVVLVPTLGVTIADALGVSEWRALGVGAVQGHRDEGRLQQRYSEITYTVRVQRNPSFHVFAVLIPSVLIVLVSFTTFWYDPRQLNAIMGPGVASMLVLVALNFSVASFLPRISYVTLLNRFTLACYLFVFSGILLNVIAHRLDQQGRSPRAESLRVLARYLLPPAYLAIVAMLIGSAAWHA